MSDTGMTLGVDELRLGLLLSQAIDSDSAYFFEDITFYDDSDTVLVRLRRKPEQGRSRS